jgi:hypothetical protein
MRGRSIPRWLAATRILGHVVVLTVAAYAVSRVLTVTSTDGLNFLIWLVAGAILHDVVLLPLYTIADLVARAAMGDHPRLRVRAVNHVRLPAGVSGVLLLVYFPSILGRTDGTFESVSGRPPATDPLEAWLWLTLAAFALSAAVYAARVVRAREHSAPA